MVFFRIVVVFWPTSDRAKAPEVHVTLPGLRFLLETAGKSSRGWKPTIGYPYPLDGEPIENALLN